MSEVHVSMQVSEYEYGATIITRNKQNRTTCQDIQKDTMAEIRHSKDNKISSGDHCRSSNVSYGNEEPREGRAGCTICIMLRLTFVLNTAQIYCMS